MFRVYARDLYKERWQLKCNTKYYWWSRVCLWWYERLYCHARWEESAVEWKK